MLAPVLWYTEDEPAILLGATPLPHAHPCDDYREGGVVYYQVNWVVKRGEESLTVPVEEDEKFADRVEKVGLRYYFYHDFDYGLSPHRHDLEMAELRVMIEKPGKNCYRIRLYDTIAFAHGTDWYSNELLTTADTKIPITLMIEEGKHASAPDRNADGLYTPGYDINVRVNDAWGVRDVLGSGFLISSAYQGFMTKRRTEKTRVLPPAAERSCVAPILNSLKDPEIYLNQYTLRPGYKIALCKVSENFDHLAKWTRKNQFGTDYVARQYDSDVSEALSKSLTDARTWYPKLSVRYDRKVGVALVFNGFDLREFYLVPKVNLVRDSNSFDLLVTQSATQFFSPYFSLGYARERKNPGEPIETKLATELGVKIRLRVDWPWRIFGAGYEFAGIRLGTRVTGFDDLSNNRFILEFGAGLW